MKALSYLLLTRMKNKLLSLKKKPAMLVLYAIITAFVIFSVVMMLVMGDSKQPARYGDERVLFLILFGLGLLYLWMFMNSGISTGSSLFIMPDVGLLFVAPVSSKKILMYGLISTFGKSLLGSIFIFYQIGNLKANLGYGFGEILALFLVFALMVLFGQLLSIGIYIFANGNAARKKLVQGLVYVVFAVLLLAVLMLYRTQQKGMLDALLSLMDTKWIGYIPLAGWTTMLFTGMVHQQLASVLISLALFLISGGVILTLLTSGKADYYEDVLVSTEMTFNTLKAAKEGRTVQRAGAKKIKVKDDELGINRGSGAYTIFYKHILEMKRKSKLIFIDNYTLILVAGAAAAGYFMKKNHMPELMVYGVLGLGIYMQFIFSMMGRMKSELLKPFIFMIPDKSITKVLAASLTSIVKQAVDGAAIFISFTVASGRISPHNLFCMIAYAASGTVFVAMTILYQRVLGGQPNRLVQMLLSIVLLAVVMGPAIAITVVVGMLLPPALLFLCTLPFSVVCLLVTLLIFATCGNLIDRSEFTGKL